MPPVRKYDHATCCLYVPPGYEPCTRPHGHDGPCAHDFSVFDPCPPPDPIPVTSSTNNDPLEWLAWAMSFLAAMLVLRGAWAVWYDIQRIVENSP